MKIGAQMRRNIIPQLKPIFNSSKLMITIELELKLYIFLSVQQLRQTPKLKHKLRLETGLSNNSQVELGLEDVLELLGVRLGGDPARPPLFGVDVFEGPKVDHEDHVRPGWQFNRIIKSPKKTQDSN